jgi:putative IMPACT (imprinted ancient) family translation regulator
VAAGHPELISEDDNESTLSSPARRETRVGGSRFIACACPVESLEAARGVIAALTLEYPDATHIAWAVRVAGDEKSHDAGEPAGTAGRPILQAIRSEKVVDVVAAVVRYFGGTKLGKGNLARAYREAARLALSSAPRTVLVRRDILGLHGPLEADGEVRNLVARHGGRVLSADYDGREAQLRVEVESQRSAVLKEDLARRTRGSWRVRA